jgi:hypothetical protein
MPSSRKSMRGSRWITTRTNLTCMHTLAEDEDKDKLDQEQQQETLRADHEESYGSPSPTNRPNITSGLDNFVLICALILCSLFLRTRSSSGSGRDYQQQRLQRCPTHSPSTHCSRFLCLHSCVTDFVPIITCSWKNDDLAQ